MKSYSREKKREKHAASNDDLNILLWGAHNEPSTHAGSETKVTKKQKQYLLPTRPKATKDSYQLWLLGKAPEF